MARTKEKALPREATAALINLIGGRLLRVVAGGSSLTRGATRTPQPAKSAYT